MRQDPFRLEAATTELDKRVDDWALSMIPDGQNLEAAVIANPDTLIPLLRQCMTFSELYRSRHIVRSKVYFRIGQIVTAQDLGHLVVSDLRGSQAAL